MSFANVLKVAAALAFTGAVVYVAVKSVREYNEEVEKTNSARKQAEEDIEAAVAHTEEVRRETEEAIKESERRSAENRKAHDIAMAALEKKQEEFNRRAKIVDEALTDFENQKITFEQLQTILNENKL